MANLPQYSPEGRKKLEAQVVAYQDLMDKLLLENPAFKAQAPIVLNAGGMTETSETNVNNPGPNSPGGTTTKTSKTTNNPQTVHYSSTAEDAVRKRHDELKNFIDTARLDLADEARLAQRIPLGLDEALQIGAEQLSRSNTAAKVRSFSDMLGVAGMGGPGQRAHEMLLRGAGPETGFTLLRSMMKGAHENPNLLAELMRDENRSINRVPYAAIQSDYGDVGHSLSPEGMRAGLEATGPAGIHHLGAEIATKEADLAHQANNIPGYKRGMETLERNAHERISLNRKLGYTGLGVGTLAATLGGLAIAGATKGRPSAPDETDKMRKTSSKFLFGAGGPDTVRLSDEKQYAAALNDAMNSYVTREFGDAGGATRKAYLDLVQKHKNTISRLGEGTINPDAGDEGYNSLVADLSAFYSGHGYNQTSPIMLPYGDTRPGILSIDKSGRKFQRLKGSEFQPVGE